MKPIFSVFFGCKGAFSGQEKESRWKIFKGPARKKAGGQTARRQTPWLCRNGSLFETTCRHVQQNEVSKGAIGQELRKVLSTEHPTKQNLLKLMRWGHEELECTQEIFVKYLY